MKALNFIRNKAGELICVSSLILYLILRLPLNLSVVCANDNQGFAFIFGNGLLKWGELECGRGPIFVLLYALIIKLFGFGTLSIIAVHAVESVIFISLGLLLYFVINKVLNNSLYAGFSVFLWILMISTPLGYSDTIVEIRSHWNLQEECVGVLFALMSLACLLTGGLFDLDKNCRKLNLILGGIFTVMSFMSKANNGVYLLATLLWILLVLVFSKREQRNYLFKKTLFYFLGLIIASIFFICFVYVFYHDFANYWRDYVLVGSYFAPKLSSVSDWVNGILGVITRNSDYLSNPILFCVVFISVLLGLVQFFMFHNLSKVVLFWLFATIWMTGAVCAIIMPGYYQPYYYHLIWTVAPLLLCLGLYWIDKSFSNKLIVRLLFISLILFFLHRFYLVSNSYVKLYEELSPQNIFKQVQSFQDPVIPYDFANVKRDGLLKAADLLNIFIKDKTKTLFIFNFNSPGQTAFSPLTYIYAKRYPPSTVEPALLRVPTIVSAKIKKLKKDLINRMPDYIVVSNEMYLERWQKDELSEFIDWFNNLVNNDYKRIQTLRFTHDVGNKQEIFFLYQRV
ncbi:MAG: hypothetical protein HYZ79_07345 [Candidatus Melainabacteria bacterium]|nr:hypothetical protein [Candidatus Melainabacteria bacterium]